jgi:MoaA/NifB/PqqE/SkfB family radical SAM enzyme
LVAAGVQDPRLQHLFRPSGWRLFESGAQFKRAFANRTLGPVDQTTIDLELTSVCNAVCTFCPREVMPDKTQYLPVQLVEALAMELRPLRRKPDVVFCGIGESTLHPELEKITRIIAEAGAKVCMTTNGARMTEDLFHRLVGAGMTHFNFSMNAATAQTHRALMKLTSYDKIVSTIERILTLRTTSHPWVQVYVSFVVCHENQNEVEDFVTFWRPRGVTQVWLHPLNNRAGLMHAATRPVGMEAYARQYAGDSRVMVDVFSNRHERDGICKIARNMLFISAEGEMRLCAMDYRRQTHYGKLGDCSLQVAHENKLRAFLAGDTRPFCEGCDFFPVFEGEIDAPDADADRASKSNNNRVPLALA